VRSLGETTSSKSRMVCAVLSGAQWMAKSLEREMEITGPMAAKLFISSVARDVDLFLIVRVFDPAGKELTFVGSTDPNTPVANGWLRVSHRRLDLEKSRPWRPYHTHDEVQRLIPGNPVELDIELWPTSIVVPAGYRLALSVRHEIAERRLLETEHHGAGLDLRALTVRCLHLEAGRAIGEDSRDFERALFFVENVHACDSRVMPQNARMRRR